MARCRPSGSCADAGAGLGRGGDLAVRRQMGRADRRGEALHAAHSQGAVQEVFESAHRGAGGGRSSRHACGKVPAPGLPGAARCAASPPRAAGSPRPCSCARTPAAAGPATPPTTPPATSCICTGWATRSSRLPGGQSSGVPAAPSPPPQGRRESPGLSRERTSKEAHPGGPHRHHTDRHARLAGTDHRQATGGPARTIPTSSCASSSWPARLAGRAHQADHRGQGTADQARRPHQRGRQQRTGHHPAPHPA